jgi:hypothetical protein
VRASSSVMIAPAKTLYWCIQVRSRPIDVSNANLSAGTVAAAV